MDFVFLIAYLALLAVSFIRVRSVGWLAIATAVSVSVFGVGISFVDDLGHHWSRVELQWILLLALATVAACAFRRGRLGLAPVRRQALAILVPVAILFAIFFVITTFWTDGPAFLHPVGYLIGHVSAEDNAKWLNFTAQFASGNPIIEKVTTGGPLQLYLVFVGTLMGVISQIFLHGYNQVAVAANSVVLGQYLLVVLSPLALAPLVEARLQSRKGSARTRIPIPFIWLAILVLSSTVLLVTEFGHMTLQYTLLVCTLWAVTFLTQVPVKRARLLTSLMIAGAMTVWLPLNVLAISILVAWFVVLLSRAIRLGRPGLDISGVLLWLVFAVCLWKPIKSSLSYLLAPAVSADGVSGGGGLVSATVPIRQLVLSTLDGSGLFGSSGGTEQTQPILALLAATAVVAAVVFLSKQTVSRRTSIYRRFAPVGLLAFFALSINLLDQWATGGGPHYGSMKFTFMATIVALTACLPFALMLLDRSKGGRMSPMRWIAIAAVVYLLVIDSFLPRSIAAARPQQWSPPIPFSNPKSYWWPAEVNGTGSQTIASNPLGCVYLPQGAKAPSALLVSQLSDAQRVYSCTRILAGLSGQDYEAQPVVDWLRGEWLGNKADWEGKRGYLDAMPDAAKDKQLILLDDGSNVIGLSTVRFLLEKYPSTGITG